MVRIDVWMWISKTFPYSSKNVVVGIITEESFFYHNRHIDYIYTVGLFRPKAETFV